MARIGARQNSEVGNDVGNSIGEDVIDPREIGVSARSAGDSGDAANGRAGSAGSSAETPRRRGRPPGSKNQAGNTRKTIPVDVNSLQFTLTGIHATLAALTLCPEFVLPDSTAETLAKNLANVMRHYDMQASQKAIDLGNCAVAFAIAYGGIGARIYARKSAERRAGRQTHPMSVAVQTPTAQAKTSPATGKPSGAKLATHAPSEAERATLLEEPIPSMPAFN